MTTSAVGALREDEALRTLRQKLQVPTGVTTQCNTYLLRFLRAAGLNIDDAIRRLESRRQFERQIATVFCTAHTVSSLQSGAFSIIGDDVFRRPILLIRVKNYLHSGESTSDVRVAVIILEYVASLVESRGVEQCILLIDEHDAGFWAGGDASLHEKIGTIVQKHYPGLIGAVLVVNSSWGTKRILRLHAATGIANPQLRQLVQFVNSKELTSLMSVNVIPVEFGGTNNVASTSTPDEFCDRVLRHWYAISGTLQSEATASQNPDSLTPARPIWMPLTRTGLLSQQTAGIVARRIIAATQVARARHNSAERSERMETARGASASRFTADETDDGRCSVISENDLLLQADNDNDFDECMSAGGLSFKSAVSQSFLTPLTSATGPALPRKEKVEDEDVDAADVDALRERLRLEMQRRKALEATVDQLKLGTASSTHADGKDTKTIEATLRKHHEHVNTLVAEIVIQNRNTRPERTLAQLIDLTDQALLGALAKEQQSTPCMSGAMPVNRRAPSSCLIT